MQQKAIRLIVTASLIAIAAVTSQQRVEARHDCGAFTDRLCAGDSLEPDEYLESPNGHFRFYFQDDGAAVIYDVTGMSWSVVAVLKGAGYYGDFPDEFTFSDPIITSHSNTWSAWSFYDNDDYLDDWDYGDAPTGTQYFVLDNSGYLKTMDQGGTNVLTVWAGPS